MKLRAQPSRTGLVLHVGGTRVAFTEDRAAGPRWGILRPVDLTKTHGVDVTLARLEEMAAAYDPNLEAAAVNYDHIQLGDALGWLADPTVDDGILWVRVADLDEELVDKIRRKRISRVSAEIDLEHKVSGGWYLSGLAVLGAATPAVPGLPQLTLSRRSWVLPSVTEKEPTVKKIFKKGRKTNLQDPPQNPSDVALAEIAGSTEVSGTSIRCCDTSTGEGVTGVSFTLTGGAEEQTLDVGAGECTSFEDLAPGTYAVVQTITMEDGEAQQLEYPELGVEAGEESTPPQTPVAASRKPPQRQAPPSDQVNLTREYERLRLTNVRNDVDRQIRELGDRATPAMLRAGLRELLVELQVPETPTTARLSRRARQGGQAQEVEVALHQVLLDVVGAIPRLALTGGHLAAEDNPDDPTATDNRSAEEVAFHKRHGLDEDRYAQLSAKYRFN